ncbi:hypothetical protein RHMOL_Rhmol08G0027500 [Rhododendron molle]|uniref:Uncharacterized protein n=1 Tax=Rhododendron molle TaxID=49168 RepID=A0ACC0MJ30_RHOML|nr:hypothetical protein RHMOL_Rhmol08G0027500 [Rhododendron molle]
MASPARPLLLLLRLSLLLAFVAVTATARPGPCHTLIFFSTSSSHPLPRNPNLNFFPAPNPILPFPTRRSVTFFFARPINPHPKPQIIVDRATLNEENHPLPFGFYSSSFRDRTKDILSVVGSLLLGIGCGGLTAATLYLIWSLFAPNRFDFRGYGDDEDESDDDDAGLKKTGYVAIPAAVKDVGVVAPAKGVV